MYGRKVSNQYMALKILVACHQKLAALNRLVQVVYNCPNQFFVYCYVLVPNLTILFVRDDQHVQHSVEQLCQQGFDFSLDDFGTGYSSFALLQKLPISALKIDRSFVAKLPDSADDIEIIRAVISLAHNLNMCVIAAGVETKAQLQLLIQNDCDQVQGFFFCQPEPLAVFMKLLTTRQPDPPQGLTPPFSLCVQPAHFPEGQPRFWRLSLPDDKHGLINQSAQPQPLIYF